MTAKKTAEERQGESLTLARHAQELREIAQGLLTRAAELQRMAEAAQERAERTRSELQKQKSR